MREISNAHMRALLTQKSCAVGMRNAKLGNHLNNDRGFTIKEDIMVRGATLEVPPPSSGLEQMSKDKVIVSKKLPMPGYMLRELLAE